MIEFTNVRKRFGDKSVLSGLSFQAENGRVTGFVGPNGSGKTTALKILFGLESADAGSATIDGRRYSEIHNPARVVGSFIGATNLPTQMTGPAYLEYCAALQGLVNISASEVMSGVGLQGAGVKKIQDYSLGMKQRLELGVAFMAQPEHLVLDEPVNGLDLDGVRWVREYLKARAADGCCVILSSHLLSELELIADDVVILGQGRATVTGTISTLRKTSRTAVRIRSADQEKLATGLGAQGCEIERHGEDIVVVGFDVNHVARLALTMDVELTGIVREEVGLEQTYLEQLKDGSNLCA